jgi:hypothetical protein
LDLDFLELHNGFLVLVDWRSWSLTFLPDDLDLAGLRFGSGLSHSCRTFRFFGDFRFVYIDNAFNWLLDDSLDYLFDYLFDRHFNDLFDHYRYFLYLLDDSFDRYLYNAFHRSVDIDHSLRQALCLDLDFLEQALCLDLDFLELHNGFLVLVDWRSWSLTFLPDDLDLAGLRFGSGLSHSCRTFRFFGDFRFVYIDNAFNWLLDDSLDYLFDYLFDRHFNDLFDHYRYFLYLLDDSFDRYLYNAFHRSVDIDHSLRQALCLDLDFLELHNGFLVLVDWRSWSLTFLPDDLDLAGLRFGSGLSHSCRTFRFFGDFRFVYIDNAFNWLLDDSLDYLFDYLFDRHFNDLFDHYRYFLYLLDDSFDRYLYNAFHRSVDIDHSLRQALCLDLDFLELHNGFLVLVDWRSWSLTFLPDDLDLAGLRFGSGLSHSCRTFRFFGDFRFVYIDNAFNWLLDDSLDYLFDYLFDRHFNDLFDHYRYFLYLLDDSFDRYLYNAFHRSVDIDHSLRQALCLDLDFLELHNCFLVLVDWRSWSLTFLPDDLDLAGLRFGSGLSHSCRTFRFFGDFRFVYIDNAFNWLLDDSLDYLFDYLFDRHFNDLFDHYRYFLYLLDDSFDRYLYNAFNLFRFIWYLCLDLNIVQF